jgi:general secretion pathway protein D
MRIYRPSITLLGLSLAMLPLPLVAQDEAKVSALEGVQASQLEKVRRQEALMRAQMLIKEADELLAAGDYPRAVGLYRDAQRLVAAAPASSAEVSRIRSGLVTGLAHMAAAEYANGNTLQALAYANEAIQLDPDNPELVVLHEKISKAHAVVETKRRRADEAAAAVPKEISNQDFQSKQKKVLDLYRSAENYFKSEQFDQAEQAYKSILQIDPYSATAYHRLREVQMAKHKKLHSAMMQAEAETMLDVQNGWRLPIRRDSSVAEPSPGGVDAIETDTGKSLIKTKLNQIIIKKVEFVDTPIINAINYLINESREADPSAGKEGVNIIAAFAQKAPASPEAPQGAPAVPPIDPAAIPVTLNLRNVPLIQAIKHLTTTTGLKYRIENDAVIITHSNVPDRIQTRIFSVDPSVFRTVVDSGGGGAAAGGGGGGGFTALTPGQSNLRRADVKGEFQNFGIEFPQGTSISYNEALGLLIATHTPDTLDQIEQIILKLNKTIPQVQIEAKFIDIRENDLNELGFDWAFVRAGQPIVESGNGTALSTLHGANTTGYSGAANQLTRGLRDASAVSASALDALLTGGSGNLVATGVNQLFTLTSMLTKTRFQLVINALAQRGYTNLLSAPRVTTTSGETAKILITREFIYPSAYTDPQVETGAGTAAQTVGVLGPAPSAFSTREVGVILEVKPQVGNDRYTINLTLSPEVIDFEGFIQYTSGGLAGTVALTFTQAQPIFNKRTITTSVTIWDGQTVLLGGLIRDDVVKVEDKVPFLGDVPLIGRLFRSKIESDVKRNLMIFLTARIVDPAGNPVRKFDDQRFVPPSMDGQ